MLEKLITVLREKLLRKKDRPVPSWEEIRKVLNQTAEIQTRAAKQQAAWQAAWEAKQASWEAKREQERQQDREEDQRRIAKWGAKREQERQQDREEDQRRVAKWEARREKERKEDQRKIAAWEARLEKARQQDREEDQRRVAKWEARREKERKEDQRKIAAWEARLEKARQQDREEDQRRVAKWEARREKERAEDEERLARMEAILERIGIRVGGITNNIGKIAEEFFLKALENEETITINGTRFNKILADEQFENKKRSMQCDLVLVNAQYLAITEVKHYLHPDDVKRFDAKLRGVLPDVLPAEYKHLRLIPVMACMGLNAKAKEEAQTRGFVLLRPSGEKARFESEHLRVRPPLSAKKN